MSSFRCPLCGFEKEFFILGGDGSVGDNPLKEAPDPCPNDRTPLIPVNPEQLQ